MSSPSRPRRSFVQKWRRQCSVAAAILWLAAVVFTLPRGYATGWHEALEQLGFLLLILAALGRIWATAYIAGRKNLQLCQSGPYSLTRNPLYFFSFLGVVGFSLALQHWLLGLLAAGGFLLYYAPVIRGEERRLDALYPDQFRAYCDKVPRFWPRLAWPVGDVSLVLNVVPFVRGLHGAFWFLAAVLVAEILEMTRQLGVWPMAILPF